MEEIAKRSKLSENEVAQKVSGLAKAAFELRDSRKAHVGYFLIDKGAWRWSRRRV